MIPAIIAAKIKNGQILILSATAPDTIATASIVSGAVAERIKIWPFFIFAAIMAGIIYPISMGWQWGGGWLATSGFSDFAGSTLVHACGGAAALAGVIVLGAREGRFNKKGETKSLVPFAASSIPLVTLGTFLCLVGLDLMVSVNLLWEHLMM